MRRMYSNLCQPFSVIRDRLLYEKECLVKNNEVSIKHTVARKQNKKRLQRRITEIIFEFENIY